MTGLMIDEQTIPEILSYVTALSNESNLKLT